MTVNTYDIGDRVRVKSTFTSTGTNTDPTTIELKIKEPDRTITSYYYASGTLSKQATGIFFKDISLDDSGAWYYRFIGTGVVEAADEGTMKVVRSEF